MTGSTTFHLALYLTNLSKRTMNDTVNLSTVPTKYYKFADVFSKTKAKTLASYHPYNLQIKLENGEKLPVETIYLPPTTKHEVLKKFINTWIKRAVFLLYKEYRYSVRGEVGYINPVLRFSRTQPYYVKE